MKFILITQSLESQVINAPSGNRYVSYKGQSFRVTDKLDIEFFSSKRNENRYRKVGLFEKEGPKEDSDAELKRVLKGVNGISEDGKKVLVDKYFSWDNLKKTIEEARSFPEELDPTDAYIIKIYVLDGKTLTDEDVKVLRDDVKPKKTRKKRKKKSERKSEGEGEVV